MDAPAPPLCILPGVMWHAAPDYARLTIQGVDNVSALYSHYEYLALTVAYWAGESPSDRQPWGFNGYTGSKLGPVAWGHGYNGIILQAEGYAAEKLRSLNPPWDNIPRLDIQCTIWYDDDKEGLARDIAPVIDAYRKTLPHRPFALELRNGYGKGDTLYMGSRKSARFFRVYDKYRAPNGGEGYENAWRFEAEIKEGEGSALWGEKAGGVPDPAYWYAVLVREFGGRGVVLPPLVRDTLVSEERLPRPKTTTQSRLRWLGRQVAPAINKLLRAGVSLSEIAVTLTGDQGSVIVDALERRLAGLGE